MKRSLIVIAFLTLACSPAAQPAGGDAGGPGQPKSGGTLNIRSTLDPFNFDIHLQRTIPNIWGAATAYNSLLSWKLGPGVDYNDMVLQPGLAERWEVSPDAKNFTFHLRKGVKFADLPPVNGRELTSKDVSFSTEYMGSIGEFKAKRPTEQAFFVEGLERLETPDPYTVSFYFKQPFVPFISYSASEYFPMQPREIYDQDGSFEKQIVGTGPFQLDVNASQKGTRWVWKRHPNYFQEGRPYLDEVRWLVLPQDSVVLPAFQTKQLDLLHHQIGFNDAEPIMKQLPNIPSQRYVEHGGIELFLSQLPARNSPVRDIRVRKAISLAIDRDEMNKTLFGGQAEMAMPGARPGLFTQEETRQLHAKHDPAEARRLLAEAGYAGGVNLEWPVPNDDDTGTLTWIQLVQAQLKKTGINVDLKVLERTEQRRLRRNYQFDLDQGGTGGPADDPDTRIWQRYYSGDALNYSRVNDPELDRLVLASRAETDPKKREEILRAIARRVAENVYYIYLVYQPRWWFWHPYVQNASPHLGGFRSRAFLMAWLDK